MTDGCLNAILVDAGEPFLKRCRKALMSGEIAIDLRHVEPDRRRLPGGIGCRCEHFPKRVIRLYMAAILSCALTHPGPDSLDKRLTLNRHPGGQPITV